MGKLKKNNKKGKVAIISRESDERSIDIAMLEEELRSRGIEVKSLCRLLRKDKSLKSLTYAGEIAKQIRAITSSDVVLVDTYCIPVSMLPHSGRTKVIQMWHAISAVKKFGWQTVGREGGSSERTARIMRMHKGYDCVACCSDITARHFCEAFKVGPGSIVKLGLPRIDYIKRMTGDGSDEIKRKIHTAYPELKDSGKKLILYAPTFRKAAAVDLKGLAESIDPEKYDIVVKLHPLDRLSDSEELPSGVIKDRIFDSYEWLSAADIVISDYSSLVVEASLAQKPLYIYAYDLEDYGEKVGLNIDFDEEPIAPYVFKDAALLAKALNEEYDTDLLEQFRKRYIDIDTTDCTGTFADFIERLLCNA